MRGELRVGDEVWVRKGHQFYAGHWDTVVEAWPEDDEYLVSGGSIGDVAPSFSRKDLVKRRKE